MRLEVVQVDIFTLIGLVCVSRNGFDTSVLARQNALFGTLVVESTPLLAVVVTSGTLLCPCRLE